MATSIPETTCEDFLEFQETLRRSRKIDDNIIHALNTTIPSDPFAAKAGVSDQCKSLYFQLQEAYSNRETAIKRCINKSADSVLSLKSLSAESPDNLEIIKKLRKEQNKFRTLQNELNVEEVVKDRSIKGISTAKIDCLAMQAQKFEQA